MGLIHWDNCGDTYDVATMAQRGWSGSPGAVTVVPGRVSGNALRLSGTTIITPDILAKSVALGSEFTRHMGLWVEATPGGDFVFAQFDEAGANHVQLCLTASRTLRVKRNGTTLITGTAVLALATWYQLEVHLKIGDAGTGQCHVKVDTVSDISDTTLDYKNGGTGAVDSFKLFGAAGNAFRYDDIHDWSGSDFKGNTRVLGRLPVADGNYHAWAPLSGSSHTAMVDDPAPDGDATYVSSDTTGQRDSFEMQPLGIPASATVYAMGITAIARKLDVGARLLNLFNRVGSTDTHGSDLSPTFDYGALQEAWEDNPVTATAWTVADVDGAEAGVRDHT